MAADSIGLYARRPVQGGLAVVPAYFSGKLWKISMRFIWARLAWLWAWGQYGYYPQSDPPRT